MTTSDAANEQNKQSHVDTNTSDGDLVQEGAGDQAWDNAKHALDSDDHATGDTTEGGDTPPQTETPPEGETPPAQTQSSTNEQSY